MSETQTDYVADVARLTARVRELENVLKRIVSRYNQVTIQDPNYMRNGDIYADEFAAYARLALADHARRAGEE